MKILLGTAALVIALTGCGGASSSTPQAAPPSKTAVIYVEQPDCRRALDLVDQVLTAMPEDTFYDSFRAKYVRIQQLEKRADTTCSPKVMVGLTGAVFHFGLADLVWSSCANGIQCSPLVKKDVAKGMSAASRAVAVAARVQGS